jgi:predicted PurR-regulated permease PerM
VTVARAARFVEKPFTWKVLLVAATIVALLAAWGLREVLLLAFAGVLLGVLLRSASAIVSRHSPLGPIPALALVLVLILGLLVAVFWFSGPQIAEQAEELRERLPQAVERLERTLRRSEIGQQVVEQAPTPQDILPQSTEAVQRATGIASRALGVLADIGIVVFLGVLLAAQPAPYVNGVIRLVPQRHRNRAAEVLDRVGSVLRRWLVAQLISMLAVGTLTWIGLRLLDVPLAGVLALIAGVLEFIPYLGPILSGIPAVLLAFVDGPQHALWVLLVYTAIQLLETTLIQPFAQWKAVWLPPALLVIAQVAFGLLAGVAGVALAAPLTAVVMVLVQMLYVHDALGDAEVHPGGEPDDGEEPVRRAPATGP